MSKRPFVIFTLALAALAIGLPLWAFEKEGSSEASAVAVPDELKEGRELFQDNCGTCHTLKLAATDGVVGPNLDQSTATSSAESVLGFIRGGAGGAMPANILTGEDAEHVAEFVATVAGGLEDEPAAAEEPAGSGSE